MASSDSLLQPPLKNYKTVEEFSSVGVDMISMLPDDILSRILSFVTPTKCSIRTSVLSKRWENLWAFSSKFLLELDQPCTNSNIRFEDQCVTTFINSVEKLLILRVCCHIETFKLDFRGQSLPHRLSSSLWISAMVMRNVGELDLTIVFFNTVDLGELPRCLYTCKTLVVLKLYGEFILNAPCYVCLPNLKTLILKNVIYLGDLSIQKLLSGCHILEDLEIDRQEWDPLRTLTVSHSSLKRLKLYNSIPDEDIYRQGDDVDKIVVDAPNLEFIYLTDSWSDDILLRDFPNIIEAHFDISFFPDTEKVLLLPNLLQSVANVRRLFLSETTFNLLMVTWDTDLPASPNLIQLELCYSIHDDPVRLIDFLRSSPKLEALSFPNRKLIELFDEVNSLAATSILEAKGIHCYDDDYIYYGLCEYDPQQEPECLRHSLKTVEIKAFEGERLELNVVKYFLKLALVIEKMTIIWCCEETSAKFVEICTELTNFSRLSIDCKIDVCLKR